MFIPKDNKGPPPFNYDDAIPFMKKGGKVKKTKRKSYHQHQKQSTNIRIHIGSRARPKATSSKHSTRQSIPNFAPITSYVNSSTQPAQLSEFINTIKSTMRNQSTPVPSSTTTTPQPPISTPTTTTVDPNWMNNMQSILSTIASNTTPHQPATPFASSSSYIPPATYTASSASSSSTYNPASYSYFDTFTPPSTTLLQQPPPLLPSNSQTSFMNAWRRDSPHQSSQSSLEFEPPNFYQNVEDELDAIDNESPASLLLEPPPPLLPSDAQSFALVPFENAPAAAASSSSSSSSSADNHAIIPHPLFPADDAGQAGNEVDQKQEEKPAHIGRKKGDQTKNINTGQQFELPNGSKADVYITPNGALILLEAGSFNYLSAKIGKNQSKDNKAKLRTLYLNLDKNKEFKHKYQRV